jgi:myo-inositol-1(or 4)-monophosphatase
MILKQVNLNRMLETAVVAAQLAGRRAVEQIDSVKASLKNGSDIVTQADLQCQQIAMDHIKESCPDHGFIAEEGPGGGMFEQMPAGDEPVWWIIDPIDGTTNYAHGILLFTVSIAAMCGGEPVVGVVFDPSADMMFTAVKGGQAQLNGRPITAGQEQISKLACVGLDSRYDQGVPPWVCQVMQRTRFRNLGTTALQLAYVARGSLIATVANTPKLWDIAAGALLVETAGALATDWRGRRIFPVDLDAYDGRELPILAANTKVHPEFINLMK